MVYGEICLLCHLKASHEAFHDILERDYNVI